MIVLIEEINNTVIINPFKGLASYEEEDKEKFFGRTEEISGLLRLVRINPLTLVYGKSGIGKSSLLKAGLQPVLREENFFPVWIRYPFNGDENGVYDYIIEERVEQEARKHNISIEPAGKVTSRTLWEYFHQKTFWNEYNLPQTPVLIFDQFEELYKKGSGSKEAQRLVEQLKDLSANFIPAAVAKSKREAHSVRIAGERHEEKTKPEEKTQTDSLEQNYRIIFSFREDDLMTMEEELTSIPRHLLHSSRFRLNPMTIEGAREAIEKPDPGLLNKEGVEKIIQYLSESDNKIISQSEKGIEPAMMSLICTDLFSTIDRPIKSELLDKKRFDSIIENFYENTLVKHGESIRKCIEEELIDERGHRQHKPTEDGKFSIYQKEIDDLVEKRLLRKVEYSNVLYVELIHDKLASIVKESRNARRNVEKAQLRKSKIYRRLLVIGGIVAVLSSTLFAYWQRNENIKREKLLRLKAQRAQEDSLKISKYDQVQSISVDSIQYSRRKIDSLNAVMQKLQVTATSSSSTSEKLQRKVDLLTIQNQQAAQNISILNNRLSNQKAEYEKELINLRNANNKSNNEESYSRRIDSLRRVIRVMKADYEKVLSSSKNSDRYNTVLINTKDKLVTINNKLMKTDYKIYDQIQELIDEINKVTNYSVKSDIPNSKK